MSGRINDGVLKSYLGKVELGAGSMAGAPTNESLARAIVVSESFFHVGGGSIFDRRLTQPEREELRPHAAAMLQKKYGGPFGVRADRILDAIATAIEAPEPIDEFLAREGLCREKLDFGGIQWSAKGVWGLPQIDLATRSIRHQVDGPAPRIQIDEPKSVDGRHLFHQALGILRAFESVRDEILSAYHVPSGPRAAFIDSLQLRLRTEEIVDALRRDGVLDQIDRVEDRRVRHGVYRELTAAGVHPRVGPDEWRLPLLDFEIGSRADAEVAHEFYTEAMIPALERYLRSLS